jgi:hypothetical protein
MDRIVVCRQVGFSNVFGDFDTTFQRNKSLGDSHTFFHRSFILLPHTLQIDLGSIIKIRILYQKNNVRNILSSVPILTYTDCIFFTNTIF